jgi:hypothetical protein
MIKNYKIFHNLPATLLLQNRVSTSSLHSQALTLSSLNPWYITGFADAESCFSIRITKSTTHLTGWQVQPRFSIGLDKRDLALLKKIQSFFGVGKISTYNSNVVYFRVISVKDLAVIIDHFDKYPLITQKRADYLLFKRIVEIINRKEHLSNEGLRKIVEIIASMNLGLSARSS